MTEQPNEIEEQETIGNFGLAVIVLILLVAIVGIGYGISKIPDVIRSWQESRPVCEELTAEETYDFCTESGFAPETDTALQGDEWCRANGWHTGDSLVDTCNDFCNAVVVPAMDCAVLRYELPEGADPALLPDYLTKADELIDKMIGIKANMETLEKLADDMGNYDGAWLLAKNDKQWLEIYEGVGISMRQVRNGLSSLWPPPPYNSSNPLMDAHGRMQNAYFALLDAWEDFQYGYYENSGWDLAHGHQQELDEFTVQIGYARTGLNLAR